MLIISILSFYIAFSFQLNAQDAKSIGLKAITDEAVEAQLEFLASDWTEGRSTGTRGAYLSADYIASMFKVYGLQAGGDHAPFAAKDIPYFYFMAGFPPEYHQSNDHISFVNIKKMSNIIRVGYLNIWDFANTDSWRE